MYLVNIVEVRPYIISGLIHLMKKPLDFIRKQNEKGIFGNEHIESSKLQIQTISKFTENYLPILCNMLLQTQHDKRTNILKTIGLFSEIGDKLYIAAHFQRTMVKCLEDDTSLLLLRKQIMEKFEKNKKDDGDDDEDIDKKDEDNDKDKAKDKNTKTEELQEIKIKYEKFLKQEIVYLLILNEMVEFIDIDELEKFWAFLKQQFMKTDQSPLIQKLLYRNLNSILKYKDWVLMKDKKQLMNLRDL